MVKKNLFEEEEEEEEQNEDNRLRQDQPIHPDYTRLKINKPFAQKFEKRVQRQIIDKAKIKYGSNYQEKMELERNGEDDESSDLEEDSDGELINDKVSEKFISTLARIRTKDPSIYQPTKTFFKEKDFDDVVLAKKKREQKMTYGDMIRKDAMRKMEQEDGDANSGDSDNQYDQDITGGMMGETIADEQKRIRDEFKRAALEIEEDDENGDRQEEIDRMFTQKKKSALQIENENKEYEKFLARVAAKKEKKDKKDSKKKRNKQQDIEQLKDFWGDAEKLDETDRFLRKYIMTKGWVDRDDMVGDEDFEAQDEEREEEADRFEAKFNFRYEEDGANQVTTYGRKVDGSLRQKDNKRAELRKDRDERKKENKKQLEEELKQIKTATKGALLERIQKIQQISGTSALKTNISALLDEDFDDEKFTKQLEKQFDSDYYEDEDADIDELKTYEKKMKKQDKAEQVQELEKFGLDKDQIKKHQKRLKKASKKIEEEGEEQDNSSDWSSDDDDEEEEEEDAGKGGKKSQVEDEDKDNVLNVKSNVPLAAKKNLKDAEISALCSNDKGADGMLLWWYCDNCKKGIPAGSNRFDCSECADYTLCKTCSDGQFHDHPLKKQFVPKNCVPPSDAEILELLKEYQVCKKCSIKLDDYCEYYKLDSNEEVVLCEECYDKGDYKAKSLYSFVEAKQVDLEDLAERDPSKLKDHITDEEVQKLVDQYYSCDFEDIISGGLKTRFKYISVPQESYGLSDEQLLYADTDALNKFVSIKKLAPYRDDQGKVKSKQLKNKMYLQSVEKSTKLNKKIVKQDIEKGLTTKEDLKYLKRKDKKKQLKQLEKDKVEKKEKKAAQDLEDAPPQLVLEDLARTEKAKVSKNRLKSYGI